MDAVDRFAELVGRPDGHVDVAVAALEIARGADPTMVPAEWLAELDRLARGVDCLEALLTRLFVEERFTGNRHDYEDPANSYLHRVLERRTGIPITLAVVAIEVGRRAGVTLQGIGSPGHFLLRDPTGGAYLDPFDGGRRVDVGGIDPELLPVAGPRQVLLRMLANLKAIHAKRGSAADLERVLRMRIALSATLEELLELSEAMERQGRHTEAAKELEEIAALLPQHAARLQAAARALRAALN